MNLSLFIILPILTCLGILFAKGTQQIKWTALLGSSVQLIMSVVLFLQYIQLPASNTPAFQFDVVWYQAWNIHYHVGVDGVSIAMILLTAFVVVAGVLVSWSQDWQSKEFFFLLILLSAGAYGFFISLDIFTLFFFLEVAVLPKFLLIGIWGSGKKEYSAMKLALMLMAGSGFVFVGLAGIYFQSSGAHTFDMLLLSQAHLSKSSQILFFPFAFVGFGIFTALFPFHTWVPDGHSSAPTAGSMFLAGISMKLGGYGCLRVATYLMPEGAHYYAPYVIALATIAIIYGAFATMMQKDLKYINAYSSVSHCGFVLLGIGMLTKTSITGAVMQMVSHGLMTALFFAVIGMVYSRTHTRLVAQMGGLLKVMPFISTIFVIVGLCSLGLPGLSGFVAEMTVFVGSWQNPGGTSMMIIEFPYYYRIATILSCASIVVTAVYILRATGKTIFGPITDSHHLALTDATWTEKTASILLMVGILAIGMAPFWLTNLIAPVSNDIIQHLAR